MDGLPGGSSRSLEIAGHRAGLGLTVLAQVSITKKPANRWVHAVENTWACAFDAMRGLTDFYSSPETQVTGYFGR